MQTKIQTSQNGCNKRQKIAVAKGYETVGETLHESTGDDSSVDEKSAPSLLGDKSNMPMREAEKTKEEQKVPRRLPMMHASPYPPKWFEEKSDSEKKRYIGTMNAPHDKEPSTASKSVTTVADGYERHVKYLEAVARTPSINKQGFEKYSQEVSGGNLASRSISKDSTSSQVNKGSRSFHDHNDDDNDHETDHADIVRSRGEASGQQRVKEPQTHTQSTQDSPSDGDTNSANVPINSPGSPTPILSRLDEAIIQAEFFVEVTERWISVARLVKRMTGRDVDPGFCKERAVYHAQKEIALQQQRRAVLASFPTWPGRGDASSTSSARATNTSDQSTTARSMPGHRTEFDSTPIPFQLDRDQ